MSFLANKTIANKMLSLYGRNAKNPQLKLSIRTKYEYNKDFLQCTELRIGSFSRLDINSFSFSYMICYCYKDLEPVVKNRNTREKTSNLD